MLFSSIPFLYSFLPAVVLLYLAAPRRLKNTVLLSASLIFYAWGEQKLVLMFAASIFGGWLFGLLVERYQGRPVSGILTAAAVLVSVGLLGYFKYADFFLSTVNGVFGMSLPLLQVALPIGISFYTFQIMSYLIDVYRGTVPAQKNPIDFAAYVAMFPQLIAGPIVRYADVAGQLKARTHSVDRAAAGVRRFILGLGKKVLLANTLGELGGYFRSAEENSVLFCWLYAVSFMLQIYFDFSGYSDMAIGLGKLFGFELTENFRYPYMAGSITEFWRRWHMSLGSWFRDYVYIPLGGNRRGLLRQIGNILIVWLLTGLWHGAAWNFVLWGVYFAVLLTAEKLWLKRYLDRYPTAGHIYVLLAVLLGFVLFQADSLQQAAGDLAGMLGLTGLPLASAEALYYLRSYAGLLVIGGIGATPLPKRLAEAMAGTRQGKIIFMILEPAALCLLLLTATAYLVDGSFNPFLYFRF